MLKDSPPSPLPPLCSLAAPTGLCIPEGRLLVTSMTAGQRKTDTDKSYSLLIIIQVHSTEFFTHHTISFHLVELCLCGSREHPAT